jgi:hypothetical protein
MVFISALLHPVAGLVRVTVGLDGLVFVGHDLDRPWAHRETRAPRSPASDWSRKAVDIAT